MIFSHSYTPFSHSGIFVSIPIYIPEYDPDSTALVRCEHTDLSATATAPFGAVVNVDQVFKVADPFARFEPVENRDFEDSNAEQLFASVEFPSVRYRKSELSALKTTTTFSYRFPNPTTGGIVRFKVTVNHDRVIVGQVKPSDDAKAEYKDIIENHKDQAAGLATSFTRDIFQIDLGNIPWDSTVRVEISYFTSLEYDPQYDGYRFSIPTSIFPRYGPELANTNSNTPHTLKAPSIVPKYGTSIRVNTAASAIADYTLECVSHKTATENPTSVVYSSREESKLEQDFVVILKQKTGALRPQLWARSQTQGKPETGLLNNVLAVNINPLELAPHKTPKELIFVLDRSGSMYDKVATLRDALHLYLASLPVPDPEAPIFFNFVSFGSSFQFLWPTSKLLSEQTFDAARSFIDTIDANYGGTEILQPIKHLDKSFRKAKYKTANGKDLTKPIDREVVVLTDGEVSDADAVRTYIETMVRSYKPKDGRVRVHSFGIGNDVSHDLLDAIATAGGGLKQTVINGERMETKVSKVLQSVLSSPVVKAKVYWQHEKGHDTDGDFEIVGGYSAPLVFDLHQEFEPGKLNVHAPQLVTPPSGVLPTFPNKDSVLYVFTKNHDAIAPSVKVELELGTGETVSYEVPVVQEDAVSVEYKDDDEKEKQVTRNEYLLFAAAKSVLSSLEDELARLNAGRQTERRNLFGGGLTRQPYKKEIMQEAEIIRLGELVGSTFGLVSSWTSLIAVEKSTKKTDDGSKETVDKVFMPSVSGDYNLASYGGGQRSLFGTSLPPMQYGGGGGFGRNSSSTRSASLFSPPPPPPPPPGGSLFSRSSAVFGSTNSSGPPDFARGGGSLFGSSAAPPVAPGSVSYSQQSAGLFGSSSSAPPRPGAFGVQVQQQQVQLDSIERGANIMRKKAQKYSAEIQPQMSSSFSLGGAPAPEPETKLSGLEEAFQSLAIVTRHSKFNGSFDITQVLYTLITKPLVKKPARLASVAEASKAGHEGYFALAVWSFLSTLEARSGLEKGALGETLKLLLKKVLAFVTADYAKSSGESALEKDREELLKAYQV